MTMPQGEGITHVMYIAKKRIVLRKGTRYNQPGYYWHAGLSWGHEANMVEALKVALHHLFMLGRLSVEDYNQIAKPAVPQGFALTKKREDGKHYWMLKWH